MCTLLAFCMNVRNFAPNLYFIRYNMSALLSARMHLAPFFEKLLNCNKCVIALAWFVASVHWVQSMCTLGFFWTLFALCSIPKNFIYIWKKKIKIEQIFPHRVNFLLTPLQYTIYIWLAWEDRLCNHNTWKTIYIHKVVDRNKWSERD